MREGWCWEMRGLLSSPGDAGGVGDASVVAVSEGWAGGGGCKGCCHRCHGSWGRGLGHRRCIVNAGGGSGVIIIASSTQVVGSWVRSLSLRCQRRWWGRDGGGSWLWLQSLHRRCKWWGHGGGGSLTQVVGSWWWVGSWLWCASK